MKTVSMSGSLRENVGKKAAKALRRDGRVPCVIYGGEKQIHFSVEEKSFKNLVYTPEIAFVEIKIGDDTYKAILQDMQFHPVTDNIYHADFLELIDGKAIIMGVPVIPVGSAKGVLNGGRLVQRTKKLKVKGLPEFMPENIEVDVTPLAIGQSIKVKDITIENVEILAYPNTNVLAVKTLRTAVAVEGEEGDEDEDGDDDAEGTDEEASEE